MYRDARYSSDPGAAAAPLSVVAALCAQPSALGGVAQAEPTDVRGLESGERDEAGGAGEYGTTKRYGLSRTVLAISSASCPMFPASAARRTSR